MKLKFIITFLITLLFFSCKEKTKKHQTRILITEPTKKEITRKSNYSYKSIANDKILDVIYFCENIDIKKWNKNQYFEFKDQNKNITVYMLDNNLAKIKVSKKINNTKKLTKYYIKDGYLIFASELQTNKNDTISDNHFFFEKNKLLKKISKQEYLTKTPINVLKNEEKRIKKDVDNYSAQLMNELKKTFNNQ